MVLYRLSRQKYAKTLDGLGAKLYPGRWNSLDVPLIYCAATIPQCMLEVLVHMDEAPDDFSSVELIIPTDVTIAQPEPKKLPRQWRDEVYNAATRAVGDAFVADLRHLLIKVPSAVVPGGSNYLMNPLHPNIKRVKIRKIKRLRFDPRLFK
jgi:RES domain-containing protein